MNRYIILLLIFFPIFLNSQGKKGFYTYGVLGYKLGSVYTTFPNDYLVSSNGYSNSYIRLGGGYNLTLAGGWMFHPNFGCEVSSTYTQGVKKKISDYNLTNQSLIDFSKSSQSSTIHSTGSLVAQFKFKNIYVYAKAGVVIGFHTQSDIREFYKIGQDEIDFTYRYHGAIMRGFNGSLGVLYPISKKLSFMIEAEEVSVQGNFSNANLIENSSSISLPQTIEFRENTNGFNSTTDVEYRREYPVSYSCIGVNMGLHYSF